MVEKVIEMLQDKDKVPAEAHWANPMIIKHLKFAYFIHLINCADKNYLFSSNFRKIYDECFMFVISKPMHCK